MEVRSDNMVPQADTAIPIASEGDDSSAALSLPPLNSSVGYSIRVSQDTHKEKCNLKSYPAVILPKRTEKKHFSNVINGVPGNTVLLYAFGIIFSFPQQSEAFASVPSIFVMADYSAQS